MRGLSPRPPAPVVGQRGLRNVRLQDGGTQLPHAPVQGWETLDARGREIPHPHPRTIRDRVDRLETVRPGPQTWSGPVCRPAGTPSYSSDWPSSSQSDRALAHTPLDLRCSPSVRSSLVFFFLNFHVVESLNKQQLVTVAFVAMHHGLEFWVASVYYEGSWSLQHLSPDDWRSWQLV